MGEEFHIMERKPYKNSIENQKYIVLALAEIMETKPFHEISVTEVCKKAGVSKNTFYRHFESLSDVIYKSIGEINDRMIEKYSKVNHQSAYDFILYTCNIWYENRMLYKGFTQEEVVYIIHNMIKKDVEIFLDHRGIADKENRLFCDFFATVFCMFLCWWSREGFSEFPEEIAGQIEDCLSGNAFKKFASEL